MAGGLDALVFGVLIFVLGTLVVVGGWRVVDARFAASAAAREAVRAAVIAPVGAGADGMAAAAQDAAAQAVVAHGYEPGDLRLRTELPLSQTRCAPVRFHAALFVELPLLPRLGGVGSMDVTATADGLIDPFRSGLDAGDGSGCG
jgi:hypothetical protein